MYEISARLISERERLGFTQAAAADLCGVSRAMWGRYEKDKASMGCDVLALFAAAGADVSYILTGARATPIASAQREALDDDRDRLTLAIEAVEEGLEIIGRKLDPERKARLILAAYDLMAEPGEAKSKVVDLIRLVA